MAQLGLLFQKLLLLVVVVVVVVVIVVVLFENKVLRRIFGPRNDKVTGERRRLHNEELNEMSWACGAYGCGEGGV